MFENTVIQIVEHTLTTPVATEFFSGTLFVRNISEVQARSVFHKLVKTFGLGAVQVSHIGDTDEYAYDFV